MTSRRCAHAQGNIHLNFSLGSQTRHPRDIYLAGIVWMSTFHWWNSQTRTTCATPDFSRFSGVTKSLDRFLSMLRTHSSRKNMLERELFSSSFRQGIHVGGAGFISGVKNSSQHFTLSITCHTHTDAEYIRHMHSKHKLWLWKEVSKAEQITCGSTQTYEHNTATIQARSQS